MGYCVHALNAVYVEGRWIKLDARGNRLGMDAQFSFNKPILVFHPRLIYNESFWPGIYATPLGSCMKLLDEANCIQDILANIPDSLQEQPDLPECVFDTSPNMI